MPVLEVWLLCTYIIEACEQDPSIREKVKWSWWHVYDRLRILERRVPPPSNGTSSLPNYTAGLCIWTKVGSGFSFNSEAARQQDMVECRSVPGRLFGCSWVRCPLYEMEDPESTRDMMVCVGCKKVSFAFSWSCDFKN